MTSLEQMIKLWDDIKELHFDARLASQDTDECLRQSALAELALRVSAALRIYNATLGDK